MTDRTLLRSEIDESANGMRVDRYIAERLDLFPRSQIAHRDVTVRIDGSGVKLSYKVRSGEVLEVEYAAAESASITAEDIELDIVFENDDVVAFRDINPQAPIHVLVVPRARMESIAETTNHDPQVIGRIIHGIAETARTLGLEENGYRVVFNTGTDALQTVPYIHAHVLAGRKMAWPPG